jgi:hypothetical protein
MPNGDAPSASGYHPESLRLRHFFHLSLCTTAIFERPRFVCGPVDFPPWSSSEPFLPRLARSKDAVLMQRFKQFHCGARQRDVVRYACLHSFLWNGPEFVVKVDLRPKRSNYSPDRPAVRITNSRARAARPQMRANARQTPARLDSALPPDGHAGASVAWEGDS